MVILKEMKFYFGCYVNETSARTNVKETYYSKSYYGNYKCLAPKKQYLYLQHCFQLKVRPKSYTSAEYL